VQGPGVDEVVAKGERMESTQGSCILVLTAIYVSEQDILDIERVGNQLIDGEALIFCLSQGTYQGDS